MRSMLGLLIVAVIGVLTYKYYFSHMEAAGTGTATPMQTIDMVGVKNDLLSIAQAERADHEENGPRRLHLRRTAFGFRISRDRPLPRSHKSGLHQLRNRPNDGNSANAVGSARQRPVPFIFGITECFKQRNEYLLPDPAASE
jgi:hypothetical protein